VIAGPSPSDERFDVTVETYLAAVRAHLSLRPCESERLIDEVRDHLWEEINRSERSQGATTPTSAIARFGDPTEVARALAAEHTLATAARAAGRIGRWSVLIGLTLALMVRVTFAIAGRRGIPADDVAAIAVGAFAACCSGALSGWSVRTLRQMVDEPRAMRVVLATCAAAGVAAVGGIISIAGLASDLVGDATRLGESLAHLMAAVITIVLAVLVAANVSSLWRPWRTMSPEHSQSSLA
jgi:hypothetical protein